MRKMLISIGMLLAVVVSLPCDAQEDGQSGAVPAKPQSAAPAARPRMPKEIAFESSVGNVLFPHKSHIKFGCKRCHHQIQAMELDTPHPEYLESALINCQDCHDPGTQSGSKYKCSDCHHSEPENISDETLSSKVVIHESCWECHKTSTGLQASEGCSECHVKEVTFTEESEK
jgi:hypothetical protein